MKIVNLLDQNIVNLFSGTFAVSICMVPTSVGKSKRDRTTLIAGSENVVPEKTG